MSDNRTATALMAQSSLKEWRNRFRTQQEDNATAHDDRMLRRQARRQRARKSERAD